MGRTCTIYGGEKRRIQCFGGKPEGWNHLKDPGVDGRIILNWIVEKWDAGGTWTGSMWLRTGTGGGLL